MSNSEFDPLEIEHSLVESVLDPSIDADIKCHEKIKKRDAKHNDKEENKLE